MLSSMWGKSTRTVEEHEMILIPDDRERGDDKALASSPGKKRDKIQCLDGLRGIACLIVFNYHFLWPWTPMIMMGYGAMPPQAPEPYMSWPSLPILCLLHRGRPMVAIFFAISGYVLCRHILRAIHERRLEAAYQSLASSVFRRVFRLYIPPTITMFLVAMLAQMGAFRSEDAIYKGPDSVYINSTVTIGHFDDICLNGTVPIVGAANLVDYMGLHSPEYLGNTTDWTGTLCLNITSQLLGPSKLYDLVDKYEAQLLKLNRTNSSLVLEPRAQHAAHNVGEEILEVPYHNAVSVVTGDSLNATYNVNLTWIQFGGSWEEHPYTHDNMTYALQNFTRAYAEWANPFNFGHYHTRYDPHTFTIPMELRGSMFIYIFLLATATLKAKWRLGFGGFLSAYSLIIGRWDMATFMGGTILSELDIRRSPDSSQSSFKDGTLASPATESKRHRAGAHRTMRGATAIHCVILFVALFFLSYPDSGAEYTPGFRFLASIVPRYYIPLSGWMFYQSMGAVLLLPCILHSPLLKAILEKGVSQYLGKISFSFYLIHGPVLHGLGFWIMPKLFERFGRIGGYLVGWVVLLSVSLYLAHWFYKKVDMWSATVGRKVERLLAY